MKNIFKILSIFLFMISCNSFSQNLLDQNSSVIDNYFKTQLNTHKVQNNTTGIEMNYKSDIRINQKGNYNNTYILASKNKKQSVEQKGDQNNYEFYSFYNSNPSQVNTIQNGNNNDIQIFGQNELTKNISIIQNTNNKTLIIKNY